MKKCRLCGRILQNSIDSLSRDCGGDCWGCVGKIEAENGWEPSRLQYNAEVRAHLRPGPEIKSDDPGDNLHETGELFWEKFRWLVREMLDREPVEFESELRTMLHDKTSCWHPGIPQRGEKRSS